MCKNCDTYKKESEKYKRKYELAKSGLTEDERDTLIELIGNEQLKYIIPKTDDGYKSDVYKYLEELKIKLRSV